MFLVWFGLLIVSIWTGFGLVCCINLDRVWFDFCINLDRVYIGLCYQFGQGLDWFVVSIWSEFGLVCCINLDRVWFGLLYQFGQSIVRFV